MKFSLWSLGCKFSVTKDFVVDRRGRELVRYLSACTALDLLRRSLIKRQQSIS